MRAFLVDLGGDADKSPLGTAALTLARDLDSRKNSATSRASSARALREVTDRLRELAPVKDAKDGLTRVQTRHDRRRRRLSAVK